MKEIHPQVIKDDNGVDIGVFISMKDYKVLMEELEELEDERLYDEAKRTDDGQRISLEDYTKKRGMM